jgi:transposase-like protein
LCFLHGVLKVIERCRGELREQVLDRVWRCYHAETRRQCSQRLRRLAEWARQELSGPLQEMVVKLHQQRTRYLTADEHADAHRTTNAVDRLMNHQDRMLYAMNYLHSKDGTARLALRAMAVLWNFHPYTGRLRRDDPTRQSPFADLNGFQYHDNWLHNFLIAASLGGHKL